jgi:hypothetical protein
VSEQSDRAKLVAKIDVAWREAFDMSKKYRDRDVYHRILAGLEAAISALSNVK